MSAAPLSVRLTAVPSMLAERPPEVGVIGAVRRGDGFAFAGSVGWGPALARTARALVVEVETDTCDGRDCHASRAFVYAEFPDGRSLAYCGHHGGLYIDGLRARGAKVIDLRYLIEP